MAHGFSVDEGFPQFILHMLAITKEGATVTKLKQDTVKFLEVGAQKRKLTSHLGSAATLATYQRNK